MIQAFPGKELLYHIRSQYPTGTRVVLESMNDPYTRLKSGDVGTVVHVDDAGGIHINWDNGSTLAAIYGIDRIRIL